MAKGFHQIEGIDYTESFSPIAKPITERVLLTIATAKQWHVQQIDINNTYLHGFLDKEVYMLPPQRYTKVKSGQVCKLLRSLYGLKQARRQWNVELCCKLQDFGFIQSDSDHCLFLRNTTDSFISLLVYVHDVIITGNSEKEITRIKEHLDKVFTIKDLGYIHYFLGIEVMRGVNGTHLNQRKYILDILADTGLLGCKPVDTPLPRDNRYFKRETNTLREPDRYRRLIGRFLYLNFTRPDVTHAI